MVERIIDVLTPIFSDWGLLLIFVATLLESGVFVASIVPGETVLLMGGFFASEQAVSTAGARPLQLGHVIAVAFAGALAGDLIGFWLGRTAGRTIVRKVGRYFFLPERRLPLLERYFSHYGARAIFLGRFAPFLRSVRTLVAGIARMPLRRFLLPDVAGAAIWSAGIASIGFLLGESWRAAERYLGAGGGVVFLLLIVAFFITWRTAKRRAEIDLAAEAERAEPAPGEREAG